jgi:uncharacterized protein (TIGR03643 family)
METEKIKSAMMKAFVLTERDIDRIIEMAWEDRTTFEAIEVQFGLKEKEVIELMRRQMKASSFKMWRKRTNGRRSKHAALRENVTGRFKCSLQKAITHNKISKR